MPLASVAGGIVRAMSEDFKSPLPQFPSRLRCLSVQLSPTPTFHQLRSLLCRGNYAAAKKENLKQLAMGLSFINSVQRYEFYKFYGMFSPQPTAEHTNSYKWPAPIWFDSSIGRATNLLSIGADNTGIAEVMDSNPVQA